ncbi:unnamed protein product [Pleuronectes platessa]|uniref:Uncharacterized protein n=1 Tax=Pleuronectes platessa TaxID=8262 RepID=A0A9N7UI57_PLEPL|nr:unnamed protein product [Pleuronectes platessa]
MSPEVSPEHTVCQDEEEHPGSDRRSALRGRSEEEEEEGRRNYKTGEEVESAQAPRQPWQASNSPMLAALPTCPSTEMPAGPPPPQLHHNHHHHWGCWLSEDGV